MVTNALLTSGHEMTEVPPGNFIFGKFRERNLHPMHKGASVEANQDSRVMGSAHRSSRSSMDGPRLQATPPSKRASASLDLPRTDQRDAAFAAATRALAGLKIDRPARTSLDTVTSTSAEHFLGIPAAPKGRATPSAKGTADRHTSWRKSLELSREDNAEDTSTPHNTPLAPRTAKHASPSTRATTTPSAQGTADLVDSWRKPSLDLPLDPVKEETSTWTPVAIGSFLQDLSDEPEPESETSAEQLTNDARAASLHSENPLDFAVQGVHTELLTQALDEFMGGSSMVPRSPRFERVSNSDLSQRSYEDLLLLSRLSSSGRGVRITSHKKSQKPSYKVKKETAVADSNKAMAENCSLKAAGKRFLARF